MFRSLTFYHWWRSSSSWRVRWALELKGLKPRFVSVNLLDGTSEGAEHLARNPMGFVPVLDVDGRQLIESTAIIEWLDEVVPMPALLPGDPWDRQHVRALCELINSGTQPLQNPTVTDRHSSDPAERKRWSQHFIRRGLHSFMIQAAPRAGRFAFGDQLSAADLYLVPQCYAASRFDVDVAKEFPLLESWRAEAVKTPAGQSSHPDRHQPSNP